MSTCSIVVGDHSNDWVACNHMAVFVLVVGYLLWFAKIVRSLCAKCQQP